MPCGVCACQDGDELTHKSTNRSLEALCGKDRFFNIVGSNLFMVLIYRSFGEYTILETGIVQCLKYICMYSEGQQVSEQYNSCGE